MKRFSDKVIVLTGAASGIGAATARRFASEGASLVLGDIDASAGGEVARELDSFFLATDVTNEGNVAQLLGADFGGFLPTLVPMLLKTCQADVGVVVQRVPGAEGGGLAGFDDEDDSDDDEFDPRGKVKVKVRTAYLDLQVRRPRTLCAQPRVCP